jgi:hypothetical protein
MARARRAGPTVVIRRGSIRWVALDPTRGREIRKERPAVVLSADGLNRARRRHRQGNGRWRVIEDGMRAVLQL